LSPTRPAGQPAPHPADALLADVESLPYPHRMRELALRARRLAGTAELTGILSELSGRGAYERRTALHMAMAARDLGFVAAVLAGPDMDLRRAALRAVRTLPVPDEAAEAVLDDAPTALRHAFYRTLLHGRRQALADRLLPSVRERWGGRDAAALLPACSGPVVAEALPGLAHVVVAWKALGKRHPHAVLDAAEAELEGSRYTWGWWRRRGAGIEAAAPHFPERVLTFLERDEHMGRQANLSPKTLAVLMRADPARAARLLRWRVRQGLRAGLRAYLASIPLEEVVALAGPDPHELGRYLPLLPRGRREAVLDAAIERGGGFITTGLRAMPLLAWLPRRRAAAEARRMLDWLESAWHPSRSRANDPDNRLRLQAFLPYEEAAGPLREAAFSGDAHRRGLARSLLVDCAARTRDGALLAEVVSELVDRSVNDQDQVRASLLGALVALRRAHLDDGLTGPLGRLASAVIEARDSSAGTRRALRVLAARVLRHTDGPALTAWALDVYVRLLARFGADGLAPAQSGPGARRSWRRRRAPVAVDHRLDRVLRHGRERDLLERLRPHLESARGRGDLSPAVAVARSLGRRAHRLPEIQDDLRAAITQADETLAREAAHLWLDDRSTREERAVSLFGAEPDTIVHPRVWSVIAGRRTNLLDTVGEDTAPPGWTPAVHAGMAGRWTPGQRERLRRLLAARAAGESQPLESRLAAVRSLGHLPGAMDELAVHAGQQGDVLADAALEALSHGDSPLKALRLLLTHGRGLTSPVAVAAMGRCCMAVPPSSLGPLLEEALMGPDSKVTVRKQAARLLERHRPPGAADVLLRTWRDPGVHRDVRIAVAVALRHLLGTPGAFEALDEVADRYANGEMLRTLFQPSPWDFAPEHRAGYASLVRQLLSVARDPGVRFRGDKAFSTWVHWYGSGVGEIVASVADPADPAGARDLSLFASFMHAGIIHDEVVEVVERLVSAGGDAEARRRVGGIVRGLPGYGASNRKRGLAERLARLLADQPLYLGVAMRLAVRLLPVGEDGAEAVSEGQAGELTARFLSMAGRLRDHPVLAVRLSTRDLPRHLRSNAACNIPHPDLLPAVRSLLDEDHLAADLVAVSLVRIAGRAAGWPDEWRSLLDRLRASERIDVAAEAWEIEPADAI
jgi:hypothetical protein